MRITTVRFLKDLRPKVSELEPYLNHIDTRFNTVLLFTELAATFPGCLKGKGDQWLREAAEKQLSSEHLYTVLYRNMGLESEVPGDFLINLANI